MKPISMITTYTPTLSGSEHLASHVSIFLLNRGGTTTCKMARLSYLSGWRGVCGMSSVLTTMCDTSHL